MQQANKKLGRGISALLGNNIGNELVVKSNSSVKDVVKSVRLDKIIAGVYQPRTFFDEAKLENLSKSIEKNGVIQPIIVRKSDTGSDVFEIIAGERRYRASKMAGIDEIPVIIKDVSNSTALEFAIIENIQRSDLSAIEEAKGYKQLIDEFGYTQEKVAIKLGKSRSYVANIIRLLNLPEDIQKMIEEGLISAGHARTLIGKENAKDLAETIVNESLSVRDAEELDESFVSNYQSQKLRIVDADYSVEQKKAQKEQLKKIEKHFASVIGDLKVKANYDINKQKGKLTIFYNDLEDIEHIINKIDK